MKVPNNIKIDTETQTYGRRLAHGQCSGCIDQHQFSEKLATLGLEVEERNYSINVSEFECLTFEFEWDFEEWLRLLQKFAADIEGDAPGNR